MCTISLMSNKKNNHHCHFGTIFEHTLFMLKLSWRICLTLSLSTPVISDTALIVKRRSCRTSLPIFSMFASVFADNGLPVRMSSLVSSRPSLNRLNHSNTCVRDKQSSPYTCCNITNVSLADFPSLKQNLMLTRCSFCTLNIFRRTDKTSTT